jgi:AcrR family transcriptional regulator
MPNKSGKNTGSRAAKSAKAAKSGRSGPRGLELREIVKAAVALREAHGEAGFSLRKLGAKLGCDPMAVLYHFGSRDRLERAMADALNEELRPVDPAEPWRARLEDLAAQYRGLALRYPQTFPLLMRYWVTGPADYAHAEMIYRALADAGLSDRQMVDVCFGLYASILGLAMAEIGGMLQPVTPSDIAEVEALPPADFPITSRLVPAFKDQQPGRIYTQMVDTMLDGIERGWVAGKT